MKRYVLLALLSYSSLHVKAQTKRQYFLPDGKKITETQLDSVNKAWGGKGFLMNHVDQHPDEIHVSPMTDEFLKQAADEKANLDKILNQPAPDFSLTDVDGKTWSLADLKGKIIVLNFWFTTCMPCIDEMPKLNLIKKKYADKVVFLAFGLNDSGTIKAFLKNHPFDYTLFPETKAIGQAYHVAGYPTSMVIDTKGVIRFLQAGGKGIDQALPSAIEAQL
jgi:thiol-disulfide isomerase/thioredoxin